MKPIVILSGPVGAGKTTVSKELVAISAGPVAYIEGDKFWFFIAKGNPKANKLNDFKMIMRSIVVASLPYARAGYEVILDFSIPPWYLNAVCEIVKLREVPLDYVVVRPDMDICAVRAALRTEGVVIDYAPHINLCNSFDAAQKSIIYDNESNAAVIASHIREGLDKGIFRL